MAIAADYIIDYLIARGVKRAYGYPGSLAGFIMDALRKRSDKIENHLLYGEQACGFAAIGDSLVGGEAVLCWATSGPGASNLVTPIADAWLDSVPVIFLTANVHTADSREKLGCEALRQNGNQELDIVSIARSITKFAARIDDLAKLKETLDCAWEAANGGRKGPVLIDLPIDISRGEVGEFSAAFAPSGAKTNDTLSAIEREIIAADNPLIVAGGGVRSAKVESSFLEWLAALSKRKPTVKTALTFRAKDLLAADDPLNVGVIGVWGNESANEALKSADLVVALGSRLANRQLAAIGGKLACKVIRADIDAAEFSRSVTSAESIDVSADLSDLFKSAVAKEPKRVFVSDVGQNMWRVGRELAAKSGDRILFSAGLGAMGFSLCAAIGASYAAPNAEIIAFCGDGGLQMSVEELHYIAQHRVAIALIVLNNGALGLIRAFQERNFNSDFFATTAETGYSSPNWRSLAKAYGIDYNALDLRSKTIDARIDILEPIIKLTKNICLP
ncbi:MAG: thiamine pyrophosphate-binding protein, partial [Helicobacteraceae bacterium]|nr:thiamine pyrophosphate-binding protein [Helicobacteraceae bacterium]